MECSNKNKSSYQRLKKDFEILHQEYKRRGDKIRIYYDALMEIAGLRGPDVVKAPPKAMDALIKANKKDETK